MIEGGRDGYFVCMPSELGKNDRWYERVRCLNKGIEDLITRKVIEAYKAEECAL